MSVSFRLSGMIKNIHKGNSPAAPFSVNIQITSRCNLRCEFCPYHSSRSKKVRFSGHVPAGRIIALIEELAQLGTQKITLCAQGEPSCHPAFAEIVKTAKQCGMTLLIVTNLSMKSSRILAACAQADRLLVNLSAVDEDSYNMIHVPRSPRTFKQVLSNIVAIQRHSARKGHPQLEICFVITRNNYRDINRAIDMASSLGVHAIFFNNVHTIKESFLNKSERREFVQKIALLASRTKGVRTNLEDIVKELSYPRRIAAHFDHCFVGWFNLAIALDGSISLCSQNKCLNIGKLGEAPLGELWAGKKTQRCRILARDHLNRRDLFGERCHYCPFAADNSRIDCLLTTVAI